MTLDQPKICYACVPVYIRTRSSRELLPRVELGTSSLPRMRSTTELKQQRAENGTQTRDPQLGRLVLYRLSYFREIFHTGKISRKFWLRQVANTSIHLPCSKLPQNISAFCGCGWIRTTEVERQQIYSLPHLATLEHTQFSMITFGASSRTRTNDRWITNLVLYQLSYRGARTSFGRKRVQRYCFFLN